MMRRMLAMMTMMITTQCRRSTTRLGFCLAFGSQSKLSRSQRHLSQISSVASFSSSSQGEERRRITDTLSTTTTPTNRKPEVGNHQVDSRVLNLSTVTKEELESFVVSLGHKKFRANQI